MNERNNELSNERETCLMLEWMKESINQSINQSINDQSLYQWKNACRNDDDQSRWLVWWDNCLGLVLTGVNVMC